MKKHRDIVILALIFTLSAATAGALGLSAYLYTNYAVPQNIAGTIPQGSFRRAFIISRVDVERGWIEATDITRTLRGATTTGFFITHTTDIKIQDPILEGAVVAGFERPETGNLTSLQKNTAIYATLHTRPDGFLEASGITIGNPFPRP